MNLLQKRINEKFPQEQITVLHYTRMKDPAIIQCNKCQTITELSAGERFLSRKRLCHNCTPTAELQETLVKFQAWLKTSHFELVDELDTITSSTQHVHCKCLLCGRVQQTKKIYDYLYGKDCYCQSKGSKKPLDILMQELGAEYLLLEDYTNTDDKLLFQHKCGHVFRIRVADVLRYKGICPSCNAWRSNGERKIDFLLTQHSVAFIKEKVVNINGVNFRFDFWVPSLNLFIEYNGKQHYESVEYWGGDEAFQKRQKYDGIKQQYCQENKINLLIIKYNDNIEIALKESGVI